MMNETRSNAVEISVKLYRWLLHLYPEKHREEYGWLMVQVFQDKARDVCQRSGVTGIFVYWLKTLLDLIVSVVRERQERDLTMSDENLAGSHPYWLMTAGALLAVASISQLQPDDHWSFYGVYALSLIGLPVGIVTMVAGLYGMRAWFDNQAGLLGQLGIRVSILGGGIAPILMFMLPLGELIWVIMMLGFVMLFSGIAVMGLDLLLGRTMPRWIGLLMILIGVGPFIAVPVEAGYYGPRYVSFGGILIVGIGWLLIGNYLRQRAKTRLTVS